MDTILQTLRFGAHRVDVLQRADDDGVTTYRVLVDGMVVTDPPLDSIPGDEDIVRIYARSQEPGGGPRGARHLAGRA
ncbi:MAG: hypothetical protein ACM32E_23205 [Gemmatimonadota bacterium]